MTEDESKNMERAALQERLEAILRGLPLRAEIGMCDTPLKHAANLLTYMAPQTQTAGRTPPMFRTAAQATCGKQLVTLHRLASKITALAKTESDTVRLRSEAGKLAKLISQLYQPTILALANTGFLGGERLTLQRVADDARTNPTFTTERRDALASACRIAAECACRARVVQVQEEPVKGPPTNNLTRVIGDHLLRTYELLTGRKANLTRSYAQEGVYTGCFITLVKEVLRVLNVEAGASGVARQAIIRRDITSQKE